MRTTRTLRGKLTDTLVRRLVVDDGRLDHGYRVVSFQAWPDGGGADGVYAVLGTQFDMTAGGDAGDNRQIAWSGSAISSTGTPQAGAFGIVDPDHIVNMDLYIQAITNDVTNYLIVLEMVTMTEQQTIMQLIKERSQDDIRN